MSFTFANPYFKQLFLCICLLLLCYVQRSSQLLAMHIIHIFNESYERKNDIKHYLSPCHLFSLLCVLFCYASVDLAATVADVIDCVPWEVLVWHGLIGSTAGVGAYQAHIYMLKRNIKYKDRSHTIFFITTSKHTLKNNNKDVSVTLNTTWNLYLWHINWNSTWQTKQWLTTPPANKHKMFRNIYFDYN